MGSQPYSSSNRLSKEILVGRIETGARLAQLLVRMKDEVGAVADVNKIAASLKVDVRQSLTYSLPTKPQAIYNAFVSLNDPNVSLGQLVEKLKQSAFVLEVQGFEGREGAVVDTISFPVYWQGRRVVILAQHAMARMFDGISAKFGTGGEVVLFNLGTDYGKDLAEYFMSAFGKIFLLRNYDYGLGILAATGWGIPELVEQRGDFARMTIRISSCFECDGRKSEKGVCSFMRGFLLGVFGTLAEGPLKCEEVQCTAKGDPYCQFELQGKEKADSG